MSFNKFIEDQIQKGMSEGLFDNLKGSGKPLNLDEYFNTPEDLRIGYSVLKSGNILPPECQNEVEKRKLNKLFQEKTLAFNMTMERYRRKK
jgi:hypothetical protein